MLDAVPAFAVAEAERRAAVFEACYRQTLRAFHELAPAERASKVRKVVADTRDSSQPLVDLLWSEAFTRGVLDRSADVVPVPIMAASTALSSTPVPDLLVSSDFWLNSLVVQD